MPVFLIWQQIIFTQEYNFSSFINPITVTFIKLLVGMMHSYHNKEKLTLSNCFIFSFSGVYILSVYSDSDYFAIKKKISMNKKCLKAWYWTR